MVDARLTFRPASESRLTMADHWLYESQDEATIIQDPCETMRWEDWLSTEEMLLILTDQVCFVRGVFLMQK